MSNQGLRQASARAIGGTQGTYNDDFLAMFDAESVPAGDFNSRFLMWLNARLGVTYTNLPEAMQAFAVSQGLDDWCEVTSVGSPAPPPLPSPPLELTVNTQNGLNGTSTSYTAGTGKIIVRIFGRNNAASAPGITVTWDGVPLTVARELHNSTAGGAFAFLAGIPAGATGTKTLAVSCTGNAGMAMIRIEELSAMDSSWVGTIGTDIETAGATLGVSGFTPAGSDGIILQVAGWVAPGGTTTSITQTAGATASAFVFTGDILGSELVVNSDFTDPTGWTVGTNWTISAGSADHTAGALSSVYRSISLTPNVSYRHSFITTISAGTIQARISAATGPARSSSGSYTLDYRNAASGLQQVGVTAQSSMVGAVDNVSLKIITGAVSQNYTMPILGAPSSFNYTAAPATTGHAAALVVEIKGGAH